MSRIVNRAEFAEIMGKSPRWIAKLLDEGMPAVRSGERGNAVEIDTAIAIEWLLKRAQGDRPTTANSETQRLRSAQADLAELDAQERRGEVAAVEDYQIAANEAMVIVATQLDGLPGRVAAELAAMSDPALIRKKLLDETRRIRGAAAARLEGWARMVAGGGHPDAVAAPNA